ncbi:pectate lyase family protein [Natronospora cellulosivora (SeqCode)]
MYKKKLIILMMLVLTIMVSLPAMAAVRPGDLNNDGVINSLDYTLMVGYLLGSIDSFDVEDDLSVADLNGDSRIDSLDIILLGQYILGSIDKFPVEESIDPVDLDFSLIGYANMTGNNESRTRNNNPGIHHTVTGGEGSNPQVVTYGEEVEQALESGNYEGGMVYYIEESQQLREALLGIMRYHRRTNRPAPHPPVTFYITNELTSDGVSEIRIEDSENISIIGDGANGELHDIGIRIIRSSNVIIRNLRIYNVKAGEATGLEIAYSNNIWVDRNHFHSEGLQEHIHKDYYDELLSIKHSSNAVTVSWNIFEEHYKAILIGHSDSDSAAPDNVTFHHNLLYELNTRTPLNRYATNHIFNNVFENIDGSGINSRQGAELRVEKNIFRNVGSGSNDSQGNYIQGPIGWWYGSNTGYWHMIDNIIEDSEVDPKVWENCLGYSYVPYEYEHILHAVDDVEGIVKENAGRSFEPAPVY